MVTYSALFSRHYPNDAQSKVGVLLESPALSWTLSFDTGKGTQVILKVSVQMRTNT